MATGKTNGKQNGGVVSMTRAQAQAYADRQAQRLLGVPASVAFERLDRGQVARGTRAEVELASLQFLLGGRRR